MKTVFSVLLLIFCCGIVQSQNLNVEMEFSNLRLPTWLNTYTPDDLDFEDELRFKHRFGASGSWSSCAEKLLSANFDNNNDGLSGGNITGVSNGRYIERHYEYWEEDDGGNCDMNGDRCTNWACAFGHCECLGIWVEDDRRTSASDNIDLVNTPSGTWWNWRHFWGSGASVDIYIRYKWTMPPPAIPSNSNGINYICGNTSITVSTSPNLPSGFDLSQVEYKWEINYDFESNPNNYVAYPGLTGASGTITLGNVSGRKTVKLRVQSRYKGGEWSQFSVGGSFDMYPSGPKIEASDVLAPTNVRCFGGNDGKINIANIESSLPSNYYKFTVAYITNINGTDLKQSILVDGLTFSLPNLPAATYKLIVKNGHGLADSAAFRHGECHTVLEGLSNLTIQQPADLPFITAIEIEKKPGTDFHVSCVPNTSNSFQSNAKMTIQAMGGTVGSGYRYKDIFNKFSLTSSPIIGLSQVLITDPYEIKVVDGNDCESLTPLITIVSAPSAPISLSTINANRNAGNDHNGYSISCYEGTNGSKSSNGTLTLETNNRGNVGTIKYEVWDEQNAYMGLLTTTSGPVNFTGLREGLYRTKVTDALGCTVSNADNTKNTTNGLYLNQPTAVQINKLERPSEVTIVGYNNKYNNFDFSCSYNHDGFVNVVASGGVPGYSYAATGEHTANANPTSLFTYLIQNTAYTFTVTDDNTCTVSSGITLDRVPAPLAIESLTKATYNGFNISCHENAQDGVTDNGIVTIVGTGGVTHFPYIFTYEGPRTGVENTSLSGNNHGAVFSKLQWNNHEYRFTDKNSCVFTGNFNLSQPPLLTVTAMSPTEPTCFHYVNGYFTLSITGGIENQYTSIFSQTFQKHEIKPNKNGNQAFVERTVSGGSFVINEVDAGTYTMATTDINNCFHQVYGIIMPEPDTIHSPNNTVGYLACFDSEDGKVVTTVLGGVPPYRGRLVHQNGRYAGNLITSAGINALTFTGLIKGTYDFYVTDKHNCYNYQLRSIPGALLQQVQILGPPERLAFKDLNPLMPSCQGHDDGVIAINHIGGYTNDSKKRYSNDSTYYVDVPRLDSLPKGTYKVILEETNRGGVCVITTVVGLGEPKPITLTGVATDVRCYGENNGYVVLSATGGNGGYSYSVNGLNLATNLLNWQSSSTFTGLGKQPYTFYTKDRKNCPANSVVFSIGEPLPLTGSTQTKFSTCGEANGAITFTGSGGNAPYEFSIYNSQNKPLTGNNIQYAVSNIQYRGAESGFYSSQLKDAKGCGLTLTGVVSDLNGPTIAGVLFKNALCSYSADGEVGYRTIALSAGVKSATWMAAGAESGVGDKVGNLKGNTMYSVLVEDIYGCKAGDTVWVSAPPRLEITGIETTDPVCVNETNGSIAVSVTGGTVISDSAPYQLYVPRGTTSMTKAPFGGLGAVGGLGATSTDTLRRKFYDIGVKDKNGCTIAGITYLTNPRTVVLTLAGYSGIVCEGQKVSLSAGNPLHTRGAESYEWTGPNGYKALEKVAVVSAAGAYTVKVTDSKGCSADTGYNLTTSNKLLKALFAANSNVSVGDTVLFVEYSWPMPDSVKYELPESFKIISTTGNGMYTYVVPQQTGTYQVAIEADLAECEDKLTKTINVSSRTATGENLRLGYSGILDLSLMPNPGSAETKIYVKLTEPMQVHFELRRSVGEVPVWNTQIECKEENEYRLTLTDYPRGLYVLVARTENSVKVVKMVME